ncbi:hypothetical protein OS493_012840 [Desmophyllum pertusum]|uniref:Uncharacterized protein n=1 Tax=Desmophyllum pertusum TaxID=174260 RepID=A0A9W9Z1J4_9CNID|nr:hypothetical protein OS493_012840 [Desmophyllum pertusum]
MPEYWQVKSEKLGLLLNSFAMHPHVEFVIMEAVLEHPDKTLAEIAYDVYEQTGPESAVSSTLQYLKRNTGKNCPSKIRGSQVTFQQMNDIVWECCSPDSSSTLSINTTYNIGEFYVTSTTYQSSKVLSNTTGKRAHLPGPAMFHCRKTAKDYRYFAHTLLEADMALECISLVGGDRDKAQSGFLLPLKGTTFLPCKRHVKDDISRKLTDLGLTTLRVDILKDIFGDDCTQEKGIVDSKSDEEYAAKVESVCLKWDDMEQKHTKKEPQFSHYFRVYVEDDLKTGMLLTVRRSAGFNNDFFYNNAQESSNFVYKTKIKETKVFEATGYSPNLKCSWVEAIKIYKELVDQKHRDLRRTVLGKGPFTLSPAFKHLELSGAQWSSLDKKLRERHLAKLDPSITKENASMVSATLELDKADNIPTSEGN